MKKQILVVILVCIVSASILVACSSSSNGAPSSGSSATQSGTVADGKTLLEDRCQSCHTLAKVANSHGDATQWQRVVNDMVKRGAVLTAEEQQVLVQYLADNFK